MRECSRPQRCHVSRVTCHVPRVTCHVSSVTYQVSYVTCHMSLFCFFFCFFFFGQSGEAYRWGVCYQWGLPRLVPFLVLCDPPLHPLLPPSSFLLVTSLQYVSLSFLVINITPFPLYLILFIFNVTLSPPSCYFAPPGTHSSLQPPISFPFFQPPLPDSQYLYFFSLLAFTLPHPAKPGVLSYVKTKLMD